jgi:hypothetical protein
MKTVMNFLTKTTLVFLAIFTMSFSQINAAPVNDDIPAELKFIGNKNNGMQFQLNLNNTEADEFTVTIKSKTGEILYREKIQGSYLIRVYQLKTDDFNTTDFTFEVVSKKNKSRVTYKVNETVRMVQDVSITAL